MEFLAYWRWDFGVHVKWEYFKSCWAKIHCKIGTDIPASSKNCNSYILIIGRYSRARRTIKNSLLWNISILKGIFYVFLGGYWVRCCLCLFEKYCKNRNEVFRFWTCSLVTNYSNDILVKGIYLRQLSLYLMFVTLTILIMFMAHENISDDDNKHK